MIRVNFVQSNGATVVAKCETGQTMMRVARVHAVSGIDGECGGYAECGTCHVYIDEPWRSSLPEIDADEESMLDFLGSGRTALSRLACQILLTHVLDGVVARVAEDRDASW